MGEFEDRVERLRETIGDEEADALLEGSTLRTRARTAEQKATEAAEREQKYRAALLRTQFEAKGVKIKPDALKFPDDFDPTDPAKVDAFLLDAGLVEPPKDDIPAEEVEAHETISATVAGGGPVNQGLVTAEQASAWPVDKLMRFHEKYPEEYEAMLQDPNWKGVGLDI